MCTETGIKDVYRGVQGACPRRAVTHAGGTAERSERRAIGMGLKLVNNLGPVRQSEIKYFVPVYFPILDRCHELQKSARIFYNITVRKPLFAS